VEQTDKILIANKCDKIIIYRKASDRSQAPHTGQGSDTFVLIEARPHLLAGSCILAAVGYR